MLRIATHFLCITAMLSALTAFSPGNGPTFSAFALPANTTLAHAASDQNEPWQFDWRSEEDKSFLNSGESALRVLMLNSTAYDSAYVIKMKTLIAKRIPGVIFTDYWGNDPQSLSQLLTNQHIVIVTYPAKGSGKLIRSFGRVLKQFVQQGGSVVFSGTDQFGILQYYGLFDLDFGYFCSGMQVHEDATEHPVFSGTPTDFVLANYVYPLDISDPGFVVLADINGYPAAGVKPIGAGKVVYLGLEYYYDEPVSTQILENTIRWLALNNEEIAGENNPVVTGDIQARPALRSEERLFAGSGTQPATSPTPAFELKIYPNPYLEKGTLDISLEKSSPVAVEMTDERGGLVAVLLPYRTLNQGFYRLELPNISSGVYFIKCQIGSQTTVKKVIKMMPQ
ncbi:MAG: T9SS type A sorting domain-containing protein [Saprospiraceae bacterium]|nr:T9SS type A sorting domain-containing protein [Saprospiraceae bacterium]